MKILLINPSLIRAGTGQYEEAAEKRRGIYPSLGLGYIAAILEREKHLVKIIDCDAENVGPEKIEDAFKEYQPDLIGFYVMTWTFRQVNEIARRIKLMNPNVRIVVGGPNITCMPEISLKYGNFDFGVIGEGELTTVELARALQNKEDDFRNIRGLVFKKGKEIIINENRALIEDLDSIPFPARHLTPVEKYYDVFSSQNNFATIIATRGCPFNCTFCDRKNRMGREWRIRSPKNIVDEMEQINSRYKIEEFMFFDDNLFVDKEWSYGLCEEIIGRNLKIIWECRARADMLLDEDLVKRIKEAGCYRIRIGFESGDDGVLQTIKKGITAEQSRRCAKICRRAGIEIFGYFMMGSPYETEETLQKTIDLALEIDPSFALFSKTIMIPGSELFDWGVENGYIAKNYWENFLLGEEKNGAPSISTAMLPGKLVDQYIKKAERKFYFRPNFIIKKIFAIKSFGHLINQIKIGFALMFK